jgi:TDG/mug DNA glycosylase family protein
VRTLPDHLAPGLDIVSIGINPSVYSVECGFNFARPGNRFWPALNASGLVPERLEPSVAAVRRLCRVHRIGFTDLVKRATARADELAPAEYARGARVLERKLRRYRPRIAWFQGTSAYRIYLEHLGAARAKIAPGLQPERIGATFVYVTPNPSGANPSANLDKLVPLYQRLARLRASLTH